MNDLAEFRSAKDGFFRSHAQSPLTSAQKEYFSGLRYFPENPALRLDVEIEVFPEQENVEIQTSTGDLRVYARYGKLDFEVEGQAAQLTVFTTEHGFFVPFVDAQAGQETYGAGRYLDPELLPNGKLRVDFNLAYNPYCAYGDRWSCPLTPWENRLNVAIRAGEKLPDPLWAGQH